MFSSKNSNATDSSNKSNIQKLVEEAKVLYLELMKFKNDKEFHEIGFDSCCSYNKWLLKAEALRDNPNGMDLMFEGFFPGLICLCRRQIKASMKLPNIRPNIANIPIIILKSFYQFFL